MQIQLEIRLSKDRVQNLLATNDIITTEFAAQEISRYSIGMSSSIEGSRCTKFNLNFGRTIYTTSLFQQDFLHLKVQAQVEHCRSNYVVPSVPMDSSLRLLLLCMYTALMSAIKLVWWRAPNWSDNGSYIYKRVNHSVVMPTGQHFYLCATTTTHKHTHTHTQTHTHTHNNRAHTHHDMFLVGVCLVVLSNKNLEWCRVCCCLNMTRGPSCLAVVGAGDSSFFAEGARERQSD